MARQSERTASGETCEDQGGVVVEGLDEAGNKRRLRARRADVHKVLVAGSKAAQFQHAWITQGGGYLIPRSSTIGRAMQRELQMLIRRHGDASLIKLYEENGVYNFYLKRGTASPAASTQVANVSASKPNLNAGKQRLATGESSGWSHVTRRRGRVSWQPGFHRQPRA